MVETAHFWPFVCSMPLHRPFGAIFQLPTARRTQPIVFRRHLAASDWSTASAAGAGPAPPPPAPPARRGAHAPSATSCSEPKGLASTGTSAKSGGSEVRPKPVAKAKGIRRRRSSAARSSTRDPARLASSSAASGAVSAISRRAVSGLAAGPMTCRPPPAAVPRCPSRSAARPPPPGCAARPGARPRRLRPVEANTPARAAAPARPAPRWQAAGGYRRRSLRQIADRGPPAVRSSERSIRSVPKPCAPAPARADAGFPPLEHQLVSRVGRRRPPAEREPPRRRSAPYFRAFVASSCSTSASCTRARVEHHLGPEQLMRGRRRRELPARAPGRPSPRAASRPGRRMSWARARACSRPVKLATKAPGIGRPRATAGRSPG